MTTIINKFTTIGNHSWTVPNNITNIEYLVVGGGGGGGGSYDTGSAGGGGGGMVLTGTLNVTPRDVLSITVGNGGSSGVGNRNETPRENIGGTGGNSVLDNIVALGGLGGFNSRAAPNGLGIGGTAQISNTDTPTGGNGGGNSSYNGSGGGGGAGGNGGNGAYRGSAGSAGQGVTSNISGTSVEYGKGGTGANNTGNYDGANGTSNTGQGGGGSVATSFDSSSGGNGGSGIVIIKYTTPDISSEVATLTGLEVSNINDIENIVITSNLNFVNDIIIPSNWNINKTSAQKKLARHAAIDIIFKQNPIIDSFITLSSNIAGTGIITKTNVLIKRTGQTFDIPLELTDDTSLYANISKAGDFATFIADPYSINIVKELDGSYTASGDDNNNGLIDGDTSSMIGYNFIFGGVTVNETIGDVCLTDTCYIKTPLGEINVSKLKIGDKVLTSDNRIIKIKNISKNCSFNLPRFIKKNQFGDNLPNKDTYISDNHAFQINNKWYIPHVYNLPIQWIKDKIIYYNLELDDHKTDNLIVNGMIMESWDGIDKYGQRDYYWFKNNDNSFIRKLK